MRARLRLNQGLVSEAERLFFIQGDEMVGVSPIHPAVSAGRSRTWGRSRNGLAGPPSAPTNLGAPAEPQDAYAPPTESHWLCRHVCTSFCKRLARPQSSLSFLARPKLGAF